MDTVKKDALDPQYVEDEVKTTQITHCQKEAFCTNCKKNHPANSKDWEIWKREKDISKMKYTKNITFPEARKIIEAVKYFEMSKRYTPNTNQQEHQTYENNQTRIKPEVITQLINEKRI